MRKTIRLLFAAVCVTLPGLPARAADGDGSITITGELRQWHKVTVELAGPFAAESDTAPNPFTDLRLDVTLTHESGTPTHVVPGYFAADGHAAHSSATAGNIWRAHLAPDKPGCWNFRVSFTHGPLAALNGGGTPLAPFDGASGSFIVEPTDKSGRDFRARGRLDYVGGHYLRFAGTGEYFLKAGADAPETLLAYADFDGTEPGRPRAPRAGEAAPTPALKTWSPHVRDWNPGDPTWQDGKGKGLIGALNYLAGKGLNSVSFLTYNAGGDGDNVWPFARRGDTLHYDCSKLDQWGLVFDHAQRLGLHLHFKTQETENDDLNGPGAADSLDGGDLGPQRRLYYRELIARFGHELALNWNFGEESTQSPAQQRAEIAYVAQLDPHSHPRVIHTYPKEQDKVYEPLLGGQSLLTGASLQNGWDEVHPRTLRWLAASAGAGRPWVVANDEQGSAATGVPPDPGYAGYAGRLPNGKAVQTLHDIRHATLWGNLLAGGAGVEYYFGYALPQNDLLCEDFRSRDRSWDYARFALGFFHENKIPFWTMTGADELVGNPAHDNSRYCFAQAGKLYLVYLPKGGATDLDLTGARGAFSVAWFNPRTGGPLQTGPVARVTGGAAVSLGLPPADPGEDWLAVVHASR